MTAAPGPLDGAPAVRHLAEEALALAATLDAARAIQWTRAPAPSTPDNAGVRATGVSDPVPSIVADPRRLAVRAAVVTGERLLAAALRAMAAQRRRLEHAIRDQ
jgi:hypothetical protein